MTLLFIKGEQWKHTHNAFVWIPSFFLKKKSHERPEEPNASVVVLENVLNDTSAGFHHIIISIIYLLN